MRAAPAPSRDRQEIAERLQGALDRLRPEGVRIAEVPRQPQGRAGVLDDVEVLAVAEAEDDHAARVGADVHDGEGPVVGGWIQHRAHRPDAPTNGCRAT